jgi:hypothetical protein
VTETPFIRTGSIPLVHATLPLGHKLTSFVKLTEIAKESLLGQTEHGQCERVKICFQKTRKENNKKTQRRKSDLYSHCIQTNIDDVGVNMFPNTAAITYTLVDPTGAFYKRRT